MADVTLKNDVGDRWIIMTQKGELSWHPWLRGEPMTFEVEAEANELLARQADEFEEVV